MGLCTSESSQGLEVSGVFLGGRYEVPSLRWGRYNMVSMSVNYSGYRAWCLDHPPCTLNISFMDFVKEDSL